MRVHLTILPIGFAMSQHGRCYYLLHSTDYARIVFNSPDAITFQGVQALLVLGNVACAFLLSDGFVGRVCVRCYAFLRVSLVSFILLSSTLFLFASVFCFGIFLSFFTSTLSFFCVFAPFCPYIIF